MEAHHVNQRHPPVIVRLPFRSRSPEVRSSRPPSPSLIQASHKGPQTSVHQYSPTRPPPVPFIPYKHFGSSRSSSRNSSPRSTYNHANGRNPGTVYPGRPKPRSHLAHHDSPSSAESGSARGDYAREEIAFTAVDPFRPSVTSSVNFASHAHHSHHALRYSGGLASRIMCILLVDLKPIWTFLFDTLPRQFYLYFLLRLPALYFSRVARIFEEADMTMSEIKGMALVTLVPMVGPNAVVSDWDDEISALSYRLKTSWKGFIDSLMKEWKTLNIVSVLLLSAILTILQIPDAAGDPIARPAALISLMCATMSLLYGCLYIIRFGNMRRTYKAVEWAAEAQKTKTMIWWNVWVLLAMPAVWLSWSIISYVVCIMAFVWRSGTSTDTDPDASLMKHAGLGPRIVVSATLALGIIYFILILNTFRRYGDIMDKAWRARIADLARDKLPYEKRHETYSNRSWQPHSQWRRHPSCPPMAVDQLQSHPMYPEVSHRPRVFQVWGPRDQDGRPQPSLRNPPAQQPTQSSLPTPTVLPRSPSPKQNLAFRDRFRSVSLPQKPGEPSRRDSLPLPQVLWLGNNRGWGNPVSSMVPVQIGHGPILTPVFKFSSYDIFFTSVKVLDLRFQGSTVGTIMPDILCRRDIHAKDWVQFNFDASRKWNGVVPLYQRRSMSSPFEDIAELLEGWNAGFFGPRGTRAYLCADSLGFAIYLVDWMSSNGAPINLEERFEPILKRGQTISIFDPLPSDLRLFREDPFFSERNRLRGQTDDWITLKKYPELVANPMTPVTMISAPSSSPERHSRWSRSPPRVRNVQVVGVPPKGRLGEASTIHQAERLSSSRSAPSMTRRPVDRPMHSSDSNAEISIRGNGEHLPPTDGSQAVQQPVVPVEHSHNPPRAHNRRGRPQVTFAATHPRMSRNDSSSRHRYRSIPVGFNTYPSNVINAGRGYRTMNTGVTPTEPIISENGKRLGYPNAMTTRL